MLLYPKICWLSVYRIYNSSSIRPKISRLETPKDHEEFESIGQNSIKTNTPHHRHYRQQMPSHLALSSSAMRSRKSSSSSESSSSACYRPNIKYTNTANKRPAQHGTKTKPARVTHPSHRSSPGAIQRQQFQHPRRIDGRKKNVDTEGGEGKGGEGREKRGNYISILNTKKVP